MVIGKNRAAVKRDGSQHKTVTLGLCFGCENVFVCAYLEKLGTWEEAERILSKSPQLIVRDKWFYVRTKSGGDRKIFADEDTSDHAGCWREEHDRKSTWDYVDAIMCMHSVVDLLSSDSLFSLNWFNITEYGRDEEGHSVMLRSK